MENNVKKSINKLILSRKLMALQTRLSWKKPKSLTDIVDKFNKQIKFEEEEESCSKKARRREETIKLNHKESSGGSSSSRQFRILTHLLILDQMVAGNYEAPAAEQYSSGSSNSGGNDGLLWVLQGTDALDIQAVIKQITVMVMFVTTETTLETTVENCWFLDNVNNYFRAVLFRMVPKHIKSYSFFGSF